MIYTQKDLEVLFSVLNGNKDDKLLQAIEAEVQKQDKESPIKSNAADASAANAAPS